MSLALLPVIFASIELAFEFVAAQQLLQLINSIENDDQLSERAKSHLVKKLQKALDVLTDENSPSNNEKVVCRILNSALLSLDSLQKSKQITPAQSTEVRQQITSIMTNLNC